MKQLDFATPLATEPLTLSIADAEGNVAETRDATLQDVKTQLASSLHTLYQCKDSAEVRKRWRIMDALELQESPTLAAEDWAFLCEMWDSILPKLELGYKWGKLMDEVIYAPNEVKE